MGSKEICWAFFMGTQWLLIRLSWLVWDVVSQCAFWSANSVPMSPSILAVLRLGCCIGPWTSWSLYLRCNFVSGIFSGVKCQVDRCCVCWTIPGDERMLLCKNLLGNNHRIWYMAYDLRKVRWWLCTDGFKLCYMGTQYSDWYLTLSWEKAK